MIKLGTVVRCRDKKNKERKNFVGKLIGTILNRTTGIRSYYIQNGNKIIMADKIIKNTSV
jgi:hypothetical protein|tara:strand:- start:2620 stop:2799 length:180 start_codon:yes stop_codon:yes gene_type:complete